MIIIITCYVKKILSEQRNRIDISSKKTYRWPTGTWKDAHRHSSLGKCKSKPQWDTTSHLLEWLSAQRQRNHKCWSGWGGKETPMRCRWECKLVTTIMQSSMEFPQKSKNRTTRWSSNPTSGIYPKEIESLSRRAIFTAKFIAALESSDGNNLNGRIDFKMWSIIYVIQPLERRKSCHLRQHGWNLRE